MFSFLVEIIASVSIGAHTLCLETPSAADGEIVAQVAVNRAKARGVPMWRVFDGSWNRGLPKRCPHGLKAWHVTTALRARLGLLRPPEWAQDAIAFVAPYRERTPTGRWPTVAARWRARGWRKLGCVRHSFWGAK